MLNTLCFAKRINTQQNMLCREQQPPYMQRLVSNPHQSLAAADGSGHRYSHKKLWGRRRILSDNAWDHLNGYRLSVPRQWFHPLSAGTVSEQICMICSDPSCVQQEMTNAGCIPVSRSTCALFEHMWPRPLHLTTRSTCAQFRAVDKTYSIHD